MRAPYRLALPLFSLIYCVFFLSSADAVPVVHAKPALSYADPSDVCSNLAHITMHIHLHVSLYVDDQPIVLPRNTGITTEKGHTCYYWLHTHDITGVLHVEAPTYHQFVLGDFLAIWRKHFSASYPLQLNQSGWQVYVNGFPYMGSMNDIPMLRHELITLAYHSPHRSPDRVYNWAGNL